MSTINPEEISIHKKRIESFSLGLPWLLKTDDLRLGASYYNPRVAETLAILERSGLALKPLGEVTEKIFIPPRFKRIYVDKEHGVPFLQGSHVVHFDPADIKYLSRAAHKNMEKWVIHAGWVLVTCSGTIGRITISLPRWDGWAASQHILRIIPKSDGLCPAGYIYAYLSSELGQAQLTSRIYGAVVDEIREVQASGVLIPVPHTAKQKEEVAAINQSAIAAMIKKKRQQN